MSMYSLTGILRCPYRKGCGPDSDGAGWEFLDTEINDFLEPICLTRRHYSCEIYQQKKKKSSRETNSIRNNLLF